MQTSSQGSQYLRNTQDRHQSCDDVFTLVGNVIEQPPRQGSNNNACKNVQRSMNIPERRFGKAMTLVIRVNPITLDIQLALENGCN